MAGIAACAGMAVAQAPGAAARLPAAKPATRIVDRGLHRQWLIERDSAHPERPARLVEVPWSDAAARVSAKSRQGREMSRRPAVRAGMPVTLGWGDAEARGRLTGTALEAGCVGQTVWVKAGLHGAVLRARVRGAGQVELERGRP